MSNVVNLQMKTNLNQNDEQVTLLGAEVLQVFKLK